MMQSDTPRPTLPADAPTWRGSSAPAVGSVPPESAPPARPRVASSEVDLLATPPTAAAEFPVADPPAAPPCLGRLGPYFLLRKIGEGGMGSVFEADDVRLGRRVAVKVIRADYARKPVARQRFLREARAAAGVQCDHIVPVFHADEDGETPYLVMPLLRGESLAERMFSGPLSVAEAVDVTRQVATGLAAPHAAGLVHRDIKPGNLWVEPADAAGRQRVRILDFGLARAQSDVSSTAPGAAVGTPAYMAPEQARGKALDGRADLYSLGVVLFEMLTGRLPFAETDVVALLSALALDTPPRADALNPAVPAPIADLVEDLLRKLPERRPATAEDVIERLGSARPRSRRRVVRRAAAVSAVALAVLLGARSGRPTAAPAAPERAAAPAVEDDAPPPAVRAAATALMSRGVGLYGPGMTPLQLPLPDYFPPILLANFTRRRTLDDADVDALAALPDVESFFLSGTDLTEGQFARLVRAPRRRLIRDLLIESTHVTGPAFADAAPHLRGVQTLAISGPSYRAEHLTCLGEFRRLREVRLYDTGATAAALESINPETLEELNAYGCRDLGDELLPLLRKCHRIRVANFLGTRLRGAADLLAGRESLEVFSGEAPGATDETLERFARAKGLNHLTLALGRFTPAGLNHLRTLPRLSRLELYHCHLTDDGARVIAELSQLSTLRINGNAGVTDASLPDLGRLKLRLCGINGTGISAEGMAEYAAAHLGCAVE